jgi:hypothetical protein
MMEMSKFNVGQDFASLNTRNWRRKTIIHYKIIVIKNVN